MIKNLQIEPTTKCNYQCVFCTRPAYPKNRIGDMKLKQFCQIVNQLLPGLEYVKLQGMGEPLLCPELEEMLKYARSVNLRIEVITNGSILNKEVAQHIDILGVSMSAGSKQAYQKLTGVDKFKEVLKNTYEYVGLIPFVWFNFVLTSENYLELEKLIDLSINRGVRYINVQSAQCWLTSKEKGYKKHKGLKPKEEVLPALKRKAFEKGITLHIVEPEIRTTCDFPATMPFVTWDGYLTPCCLRPDMRIYNFGNVLKEELKTILESEKYQAFVKNSQEGSLPEICQGCTK